ncbi:MAG: hypothetical protein WDN46_24915 [Methylocella sp.]
MEFTVKLFENEQTAVVEVKWFEQSTRGWIVAFATVSASSDEIAAGLDNKYNPIRLRVIEKAQDFFCRFPETLSTVDRSTKISGSDYRRRSHFELASAETDF